MKECLKCGIIKKSRISSCCARGGAWFKKCGNTADINFDHTWIEGIQSCNTFASSTLVEVHVQALLEKNIAQAINLTDSQNTDQQHGNIHVTGTAFDARTTDYEDRVELAIIAALLASGLLIDLCSYI